MGKKTSSFSRQNVELTEFFPSQIEVGANFMECLADDITLQRLKLFSMVI